MTERVLYFLVGLAAGAALLLVFGGLEATTFPYREVIVRTEEIEAREPPARPPTIIERIQYREIDPQLLARAPGGAVELTARFCAPVTLLDRDTVEVVDTVFLMRSVVHNEPSWFTPWRADELRLTGPQNTGGLLELTYATRGSFDVRADGPGVRVRQGRFNVLGDIADTGARLWTLYSILSAGLELVP